MIVYANPRKLKLRAGTYQHAIMNLAYLAAHGCHRSAADDCAVAMGAAPDGYAWTHWWTAFVALQSHHTADWPCIPTCWVCEGETDLCPDCGEPMICCTVERACDCETDGAP